jgi:uncharacterized membrane protein
MMSAPLWKQYFAALLPFGVIDLLWLGVIARGFYRRELGVLMRDPINKPAALAFYLLYPLGLLAFVFPQALAMGEGSVARAFAYGAMLGAFAYGTYDLTNLATTRGYTVKLAMVDWVWGTLLTGTVAAIAVIIIGRF